jgi:hypothetical protein
MGHATHGPRLSRAAPLISSGHAFVLTVSAGPTVRLGPTVSSGPAARSRRVAGRPANP